MHFRNLTLMIIDVFPTLSAYSTNTLKLMNGVTRESYITEYICIKIHTYNSSRCRWDNTIFMIRCGLEAEMVGAAYNAIT